MSASAESAPALGLPRGSLRMGSCGWTDDSLARCARFYPSSARTAIDRLRHYSRRFACVEIDTSTYAIPSPRAAQQWVDATPRGFTFHAKAFGALCGQSVPYNSLPREVRGMESMRPVKRRLTSPSERVSLSHLPSDAVEAMWRQFDAFLRPLRATQRLGAVVFQFQASFLPSAASREAIEECRRKLHPEVLMAVDFRSRAWTAPPIVEETARWLHSLRIALVASDDLLCEAPPPPRGVAADEMGRLPIALLVTNPDLFYARIHRRQGSHRVLSQREREEWLAMLARLPSLGLRGPAWLLWGTDFEDHFVRNAALLSAAAAEAAIDWPHELRDRPPAAGSITRLLLTPPSGATACVNSPLRSSTEREVVREATPSLPAAAHEDAPAPSALAVSLSQRQQLEWAEHGAMRNVDAGCSSSSEPSARSASISTGRGNKRPRPPVSEQQITKYFRSSVQ
ncbi:hypothetical protein AB1Y20_013130 [Prymnesium parvum]|uniref:DUF72 domain-containing protein n=1 Tax=Prymnesium parvum TaxID=97485 RepID=A0AB34INC8_PRYPA